MLTPINDQFFSEKYSIYKTLWFLFNCQSDIVEIHPRILPLNKLYIWRNIKSERELMSEQSDF